ncbi:MAG: hypothetical protein IRZ33_08165 [Alicyclobacillaceae bacterium]|nr:hypothetical protein [Alicyclobacillaceae bacterium]
MPTLSTSPHPVGPVIAYWLMLSVLALVTTFGVGLALNMLFRRWWMSVLLFVVLSVWLFIAAGTRMILPEWILYFVGALGVLLSVLAVRALKRSGYPLFS